VSFVIADMFIGVLKLFTINKPVSSKSSCRSGVGTLLGEGGELVTDDKEKADLFNNYFASVCCVDDGSTPHAESYVSTLIAMTSRTDSGPPAANIAAH